MTNESPNKPFLIDSILIVSITDTEGNITYASDRFCELSQYTCEELIGQNHSIINSGYHPQNFFREMWKTISDGGIWEGEICNRAKDGSLFWSSARIAPLIQGNGKPSQYVAVYNDITSLKETENQLRGKNHLLDQSLDIICRKESEAELRRILQLSKIGEWTAGLAHEIKNPLAGIKGVVDVLI